MDYSTLYYTLPYFRHDITLVTILSGTNNIRSGGTRHQVTEIKIHQFYDSLHSWHNDIAVMKVEPPFTFDDFTSPVKLPAFGQTTAVNSSATVIGWGVTSEGGSVSPDLRKADILIFDHEECDKIYSEDYHTIYPEQICAYTPEGGVGSCNGDSGGPLFVNGEVIGLVSWARGCDRVGYPTVYTEVADYIDWIEEKIQS
ncbi:hypothetical protein J437_LFUL009258 [Ladona fulva]|uniref:Peptidase S1 domain-containing protein n=1 Tax=Ladona fulva TaxID=123851 RepID=A0A8K0P9C1_LADFU|nr:hypothetical protein J437_LFUL009258 [Ladona fulva]